MKWMKRLERRFGRYAVPNIVPALVVGQIVVYGLSYWESLQGRPPKILETIWLLPDRVLAGEVWRVFTFLIQPPQVPLIWLLLGWYLLYMYSSVLERDWGVFKFNLYLLIGWIATVAVSFFIPPFTATNAYLYTSLFLAFAQLYPDFTFMIYFVLPVKAKWLALLTWLTFAIAIFEGGWPQFWLVLATVADFLLFFAGSLWRYVRHRQRRHRFEKMAPTAKKAMSHECRVCGLTSDMAPKVSFRYCSQCSGQQCYCPDHIRSHEHVIAK
ncbi:MAG: hypothetical protein WD851_15060 [Pirellulales bacterium]